MFSWKHNLLWETGIHPMAKKTSNVAKLVLGLLLLALSSLPTEVWAAKTGVTLGLQLEPPHLDPTAGAAAAIGEVTYANIFEGLTRIDRDGNVQPGLAERWTVSPDGKSYTFSLRRGITFHDGQAFDAGSVKFSLDRARASDSVNPQKALFLSIDAVDILDPTTVTVRLKRPVGRFLFDMGQPAAIIVSEASAAKNKNIPVGTGPFVLSRWIKGDRIELKRNPTYWGKSVALESATFKIVGDPNAAFTALLAGDIDAFANYPAPENVGQLKDDPRLRVVVGHTEGKTILAINNTRKPFDDIRVRQALAHAVDRRAVIDGAMYGLATPIGSHYSPLDKGYVDLTKYYPYNRDQARQLLKDAGVENLMVRLALPPPSYARRSGEIVAAQLGKIGINVVIEQIEWAQWLSDVFKNRNYDLTIVSHVEPFDLDIYARDDYYFGYNSAEYKAIYEKLAEVSDEADRMTLLRQAQERITGDSVNVFLFLLPKIGVWDAKLAGLWENTPIPVNDLTEAHWLE